MSHYSKVSPRFWTGSTGRAIRGDLESQVVATYLVTSPHANMLGFYYLPVAYIANDTGIHIEGASKALQRLSEEGFCRYDMGSEVVWIVEMARIQIGDALDPKDKRCKAVEREYGAMPNNPFLQEFFSVYGAAYHIPIPRAFEAPSKPVAVAVAVAVPAAATTTKGQNLSVAPRAPAPKKGSELETAAAWAAYTAAFVARYRAEPTRNTVENAAMAAFVKLVPVDEAPEIAAFYVAHNKPWYATHQHSVKYLRQDAAGLRTQWLSGRTITDTEARQADRTQANGDAFRELIQEADQREGYACK